MGFAQPSVTLKLSKETGGRTQLEARRAMRLGDTGAQWYDQVKDGSVDITRLSAGNLQGPGVILSKSKPINTVADLPRSKVRGPSRPRTKIFGYLGAKPIGMPLPATPDARPEGTIDACVLAWAMLPSMKGRELISSHCEFNPAGGALYPAARPTRVMTRPGANGDAQELSAIDCAVRRDTARTMIETYGKTVKH